MLALVGIPCPPVSGLASATARWVHRTRTEQVHIGELKGKIPYFEKEFAYEYGQVEAPKVEHKQASLI
jgi:hypothetical protein